MTHTEATILNRWIPAGYVTATRGNVVHLSCTAREAFFGPRAILRPMLETGRFVRFTFVKKDGTERVLVTRKRAFASLVKGVGLRFDPDARGVLICADIAIVRAAARQGMTPEPFRQVTTERVSSFRAEGLEFRFAAASN